MTKTLTAACALLLVVSQFSVVKADELLVGSKAPKLEVQKFIKGEEVKKFEKGKTYVVELWATWCGPCLATIPHLTELQKKYEDVVFIGVAVLEEDQKIIPDFVEEMGKKMEYRVAIDDVAEGEEPAEGKVVKNWMEAAGQTGIPSAFVVNGEGVIAWIGHPAEMEEPLSQIVDGTWDLVAEAKKFADAKELQAKMAALQAKMEGIVSNLQKLYAKFSDDNDPEELLKALGSAETELPEQAIQFQLFRFQVLSVTKGRTDEAIETANAMLESKEAEDPQLMNHIAWIIVNPERDTKADPKLIKLALKVILRADEMAEKENPSIADTLAKVYFDTGDYAKAVKTQERVVELAEGTQMAADPSIKKRLKQYKKALDAATAKSKAE